MLFSRFYYPHFYQMSQRRDVLVAILRVATITEYLERLSLDSCENYTKIIWNRRNDLIFTLQFFQKT